MVGGGRFVRRLDSCPLTGVAFGAGRARRGTGALRVFSLFAERTWRRISHAVLDGAGNRRLYGRPRSVDRGTAVPSATGSVAASTATAADVSEHAHSCIWRANGCLVSLLGIPRWFSVDGVPLLLFAVPASSGVGGFWLNPGTSARPISALAIAEWLISWPIFASHSQEILS